MTRTTGAALTAMTLLLAVTAVQAQAIHGRVRQTWSRQSTDQQDDETDVVTQDYQLNFRNLIARNLSWQTRLRALLRGSDRDDGTSSSDTELLEPFLQVVYDSPAWTVSGGGRMTRVTPKGARSDAEERERRDFFARAGWTGEVGGRGNLNLNWSGYRLELEDQDIDTTVDDRSIFTVAYAARAGALTLDLENRGFEDLISGFTRDSTEITGTGNFRKNFPRARLTVSGRALASEEQRTENTPDADDVRVERDPRSGLFAVDLTPLDGALGDTPGLIDGDEVTATVADLDGRDRNMGADFGFAKEVRQIFVNVERRIQPGNEADYTWEIYSSSDGITWSQEGAGITLLFACSDSAFRAGATGFCFEPLRNRFEIQFTPVTERFIKIVNTDFSLQEVPLAVTELEFFGEERRVGTTELTSSRQSGNLSVAWRTSEKVRTSLHLVGSRQTSEGGTTDQTEEDWSSTVVTSYRPRATLTARARLQAINRNSTAGRPERDRIASVGLAGSPLPDLDLSATGTRRRNHAPGGLIAGSDSINLRTAARLATHTTTSLDVVFTRQDQREVGRVTNRRTGRVALVSTLRPGLLVTNDWTVIRLEFEDDEELPSRTDYDLRFRVAYRPTRVLGGSLEYLYQDVAGRDGTSRLLDLDWLPFPGGAIQIQLSLVRDRLGEDGATRDEDRIGLRWTLNPRTILESTYGTQRRGDRDVQLQTRTLSTFLEFRF